MVVLLGDGRKQEFPGQYSGFHNLYSLGRRIHGRKAVHGDHTAGPSRGGHGRSHGDELYARQGVPWKGQDRGTTDHVVHPRGSEVIR